MIRITESQIVLPTQNANEDRHRTNRCKQMQALQREGNLRKLTAEPGFAWIHVTNPILIGKTDSLWNRNLYGL